MARSWLSLSVVLLCLGISAGPLQAEPAQEFGPWLESLKSDALTQGISQATVAQSLSGLQVIDKVLELDRRQPEFTMTFETYLSRIVNPTRVADGRALLQAQRPLLNAVAARYGVPAKVIVAMSGIESNYGHQMGGYPVIAALATLAYDGRRSQYFRGELINALKIVDNGLPPSVLQGSWAGAMGQCQFMPTTYLKFAQSFDGQGAPDIWRKQADVFASTANYLASIGWKAGESWGRPVLLPRHGIAPQLMGLDNRRSLREWNKLGVRQADGKPLSGPATIRASLIRADRNDDQSPPYLVYDNFRVFMKWNRSVFFAIAAGTLADSLQTK